jgi:hypothetical protein
MIQISGFGLRSGAPQRQTFPNQPNNVPSIVRALITKPKMTSTDWISMSKAYVRVKVLGLAKNCFLANIANRHPIKKLVIEYLSISHFNKGEIQLWPKPEIDEPRY